MAAVSKLHSQWNCFVCYLLFKLNDNRCRLVCLLGDLCLPLSMDFMCHYFAPWNAKAAWLKLIRAS